MEKPKPTQNTEQEPKTLEDYVVATFHVDVDPDDARRPLTVIRGGRDGKDVKYDRGWNPIGMSVVCDTDSEEGIGPIKLLMEAYKLVGTDIKTEFVPLEDIQGLNEDYIKYLYGKTPKEMIEEAKQILRQKHTVGSKIESLAPGVGSDSGAESPSNSSVVKKDGSDHEKPSIKKVSLKMGSVAVKVAGVRKPIDTNRVETNEPVRELVETDKTGVGSPALVMTKKEVPVSIGAIKVNDAVGLSAVESVKKPAEIDKVGASPADLVATEPVKKPVETNEANTDILPESFKDTINSFEQATKDNNNQFFEKAKYITGELNHLRGLIKDNPTAMNNPAISGMIISESGKIRNLEASRSESVNKFKNDINSLLEGLKSEIENEDEKRRRLIKLTEHVNQISSDDIVLGEVTNGLLDKFTAIRKIIDSSQNDRWGMDGYVDRMISVINGIISDLSIASGYRRGIVGGIEGIKREGYHQKR